MKTKRRFRLQGVHPFGFTLLLTVLCGILFFSTPMTDRLSSTIISIGLDVQRARFVTALLQTAATALAGILPWRHLIGAQVGAVLIFCIVYLSEFIRLQMQPSYDPAGNPYLLNTGALIQTALIMVALAALGAFMGAAIGKALSETLSAPIIQIRHVIRSRRKLSGQVTDRYLLQSERPGLVLSCLQAGCMLLILLLASRSADLFIFSPDVGLHPLAAPPNTNGTVIQDQMISQALGGRTVSFLVYLPPSYTLPQGKDRRYPTLYLLHGTPGKMHDWLTGGKAHDSANTLIAAGRIPELILVLPDGNGQSGIPSEWGNSADGEQLMENYIVTELVATIDQRYRTMTDAAHRGIGGLSMGGFGAMNIAVHHPDIFGTVISLGGYYRAEGAIWGEEPTYKRSNSPIDTFPQQKAAWNLHIYLGAAEQDQPYYNHAKEFMQQLDTLKVPYHLDLQPGRHAWNVWQAQIYRALAWIQWGK